MPLFRKKPVVIEAVQWDGGNVGVINAFIGEPVASEGYPHFLIRTLEGKMEARPGDWIIRGVKGEFYPCKPDIFAATYEPAVPPAEPPSRIVAELLGRVMACVLQNNLEGAKAEFAAWEIVFPFGEPVARPTGKMQWINRADFPPAPPPRATPETPCAHHSDCTYTDMAAEERGRIAHHCGDAHCEATDGFLPAPAPPQGSPARCGEPTVSTSTPYSWQTCSEPVPCRKHERARRPAQTTEAPEPTSGMDTEEH